MNNRGGNKKRNKKLEDQENESKNVINEKVLDLILEDDEDMFTETVSQLESFNGDFELINTYKVPNILTYKPTYLCLCAFFNAEKCFNSLSLMISPEEMKKPDLFDRSPIHFACAGGNLDIIRCLDQNDFDFEAKDYDGSTPAHYAAMAGHIDVIRYLWTKGCNLTQLSYRRMTPMHVACLYGNMEVVRFLGETVKMPLERNFWRGSTPLHFACEGGHLEVAEYILSKKDEINFTESLDSSSRTPLLCACHNGSLACVKLLLKQGVTIDKKSRKHVPLIEAAEGGYLDIVCYLLNKKGVNIRRENSQHVTALQAAICNKHLDIVKVLIENKALTNDDTEMVGNMFLIACGYIDPNAPKKAKRSCAWQPPKELLDQEAKETQKSSKKAETEESNNKKDDENKENTKVEYEGLKIVKYLDQTLKIPYNEKSGSTTGLSNYKSTIKMSGENTWGDKFIQQACLLENQELVSFLLTRGCTLTNVDLSTLTKGDWSDFLDFLINNGADLSKSNSPDDSAAPPIVSTVKTGQLKRVRALIARGAKISKEIIEKYFLVHETCAMPKVDMLKFLLSFNPDITSDERDGVECLTMIARGYCRSRGNPLDNYLKMTELLLSKGCKPQLEKSKKSKTGGPYNEFNEDEDDRLSKRPNRFGHYIRSHESAVSVAAEGKAMPLLKLYEKYNACDFSKTRFSLNPMGKKECLPILKFFIEKGNKIFEQKDDNKVHGWYTYRDRLSELLDFRYGRNKIDDEVIEFIIDNASVKDIECYSTYSGNFIDYLIREDMYEMALKYLKKIGKLSSPIRHSREEYVRWAKSSNNEELIKLVGN